MHEEDANTLHFSIPPAPSNLNEISDEDLQRVVGGTDIVITRVGIASVALTILTAAAGVTAAVTAVGTAGGILKGTGTW